MSKSDDKKNNIFKAFFTSFGLFLLLSFITAIVLSFTSDRSTVYLISYIISLLVLIYIYKDIIILNIKSFKEDFTKNWISCLRMYIIFTILMVITNYSLFHFLGLIAENEEAARQLLLDNPLKMIIVTAILGPLVEEIVFKLPYHDLNKKYVFIFYSVIFALTHISLSINPLNYLFAISYLFLSFGISYSYYKTNNIIVSMLFHILNNCITIITIFCL